jgi:hypothetical protein
LLIFAFRENEKIDAMIFSQTKIDMKILTQKENLYEKIDT